MEVPRHTHVLAAAGAAGAPAPLLDNRARRVSSSAVLRRRGRGRGRGRCRWRWKWRRLARMKVLVGAARQRDANGNMSAILSKCCKLKAELPALLPTERSKRRWAVPRRPTSHFPPTQIVCSMMHRSSDLCWPYLYYDKTAASCSFCRTLAHEALSRAAPALVALLGHQNGSLGAQ